MNRIKPLILSVLVAISATLSAQDIHFSQFYLSPLTLNPAMTGVMNANMRVTANVRNQWASILKSSAFNTSSVSYDQRIAVGRYDYVGVGGVLWGDKAGSANFVQTQAKISASYSKRMGGGGGDANYLVLGADVGFGQRGIDFTKLQWGTQHDGNGGFNGDLSANEAGLLRDNVVFPDMSAGLMWFSVFNKVNSFYLGGAYNHLNQANVSFRDNVVEPLNSRFTVHTGGEFMLGGKKFGLVPNVIWMLQGPNMQLNAGTAIKFVLSDLQWDYQSFQVGAWTRIVNKTDNGIWSDAAIVFTRFDYNNFTLGFSYDVNISNLSAVSRGNGAFEFALQYKILGNERRNVYCPNF